MREEGCMRKQRISKIKASYKKKKKNGGWRLDQPHHTRDPLLCIMSAADELIMDTGLWAAEVAAASHKIWQNKNHWLMKKLKLIMTFSEYL